MSVRRAAAVGGVWAPRGSPGEAGDTGGGASPRRGDPGAAEAGGGVSARRGVQPFGRRSGMGAGRFQDGSTRGTGGGPVR